MAPDLPIREVGIRPGEKLHEMMCPGDMSYNTYEYDDHYVIAPSIQFYNRGNDFTINALKEHGKLVQPGFEYVSDKNPHFLSIEELVQFNRDAML